MLLQADVTDDVVVGICILARPEVPRLLLGIVWALFKTFHLAFKVKNVVSLLISKRAVLISQNIVLLTLFLANTSIKFCFSNSLTLFS